MDDQEIIRISKVLRTTPNISLPSTREYKVKITLYGALLLRLRNAQSPRIETLDVNDFFNLDHFPFPAGDREERLGEFETLFKKMVDYVIQNDNGNDTPVLKFTSFTVTPSIIESLAKLVESHPKYLVSEAHIDSIKSKIEELENNGDTTLSSYQEPFERLQQANRNARTYAPIAEEVKIQTNPFYQFATACYKCISAMLCAVFPNRNSATSDIQGNVPLAVIPSEYQNETTVIDPQRMTTPGNISPTGTNTSVTRFRRRPSLSSATNHRMW